MNITQWIIEYTVLLDNLENAVADCAELSNDDPTLSTEQMRYEQARRGLDEHVNKLTKSFIELNNLMQSLNTAWNKKVGDEQQ
jgi:predicted nuclease with TOPRIM domain